MTVDPDSLLNIELGHKPGSSGLLKAWARALRIKPLDVHRPDDLRNRLNEMTDKCSPAEVPEVREMS